ncbi:MAG: hypothetical protein ACE5G8_17545, partial [Anaerolineae bacterium]
MSIRTQANLNAIPSPFPPRRTLNRLASALLALALGGAAQAAFGRHSLWDGLALYAVAAVLFARAVGRAGPGRTRKRVVAPPELSGGVRQVAGGWLVFGALLFSLAGQRAFAAPDAQAQAWWL